MTRLELGALHDPTMSLLQLVQHAHMHTDGQQPPNLCGAVTFIQYAYKDQQPNNSFKHSGGFFHKQTTSLTAQQLLSSCSGQVLLLFQTSAERFRVNRLLDYYYQLSTLLVHYVAKT